MYILLLVIFMFSLYFVILGQGHIIFDCNCKLPLWILVIVIFDTIIVNF